MKYLIIIFIIASFLRFYGLNWDQGYHLHPDERMITMVATSLNLQNLNPHFFAYGSLPIYLLKVAGFMGSFIDPEFGQYQKINLLGRGLSAVFDLGTLLVLYFLAKKVFSNQAAILTALFYALAVLPIQLSHFYAVDTLLTLLITLTLYLLLIYHDHPTLKNILLVGIIWGLALATKTSALLLGLPILITLLLTQVKHLKLFLLHSIVYLLITAIAFIACEPFALLDFPTFWKQTLEQQAMTKNAFVFPYTLQYVGKIPYLYELKNIFFWGLGPVLAIPAFIGTFLLTLKALYLLIFNLKFKIFNQFSSFKFSIFLLFFWSYFLVVGGFAIGFMRYMLPLYPLFCLFAAILIYQIYLFLQPRLSSLQFYILHFTFYIFLIIWPLTFVSIYSQPTTRVLASEWINQNIPQGKTLALEHWDDGLPLWGQAKYRSLLLPLYDPETPQKWLKINQILQKSDYIIIASNRLYVPLQKLTDCTKLPPGRCYQKTNQYYQQLFNGSLGFTKVAEFSVLPTTPMFHVPLTINDFSADESFTVYDHPKIMIFKKTAVAKDVLN